MKDFKNIRTRIGLLTTVFLSSTLASSQNVDPFSETQLVAIYQTYKRTLADTLHQEDLVFFIDEVIKRHGLDFAPTDRVRARLKDEGLDSLIVQSLRDEIYKHRGVELYVFEFKAEDERSGNEFARLVHHEVENQKPRILSFMDRKIFPPGVLSYETWASMKPDHYALFVTGDINQVENKTIINAVIRFRPARTNQDLSLEIEPLELEAQADRETAKIIATWFIDSIAQVFSE